MVTPPGEPVLSLRERTRLAVKAQVAEIALEMFLSRGFEQTTIEQIAKAAGMSRATFFRYFATKEDVLLVMTEDYARHAQDALKQRPDDEPVWTALRHALEPAVRQQGKGSAAALQTARAIVQSPSVRSRYQERYLQLRELLRPEVIRRTGTTGDPGASALIASALGCLDAAIETWVERDGTVPLHQLLDRAMDAVHPLAPDPRSGADAAV
ncbi:TetR family transcriptional regulator [Streptomyces sp. W16]|uniref:TetR family transcriptional regulator n=1 Tax=Streptomyces sp. W16 TaxID=3076631 RepID=UPI00295AE18F|nr:TetR family transcriptional regulator [Streptomyces sp. W16]MDV9168931.1 TetR family transcriptional regulator [Streptomyces sp. W16]